MKEKRCQDYAQRDAGRQDGQPPGWTRSWAGSWGSGAGLVLNRVHAGSVRGMLLWLLSWGRLVTRMEAEKLERGEGMGNGIPGVGGI